MTKGGKERSGRPVALQEARTREVNVSYGLEAQPHEKR